jgi:murein DD-endopeptidase MepM/ murein hydrolase activator NlpD
MRPLELKAREEDWLHGDDVKEVQRALGLKGRDVDGWFGPVTAAAVEDWKCRAGFPLNHINGHLGFQGLAWLLEKEPMPAAFSRRARERAGKGCPGRNKLVRPLNTPMGAVSEFRVPDAEGAPAAGGKRYHAAKDWFAPGGTPVRAPLAGKAVEAKPSRGSSGQVFGGTVKILAGDGKLWVFRHVNPRVSEGARVQAGQVIATVTDWKDGADHTHIEVWKTLAGGYRFENMLDPVPLLR